MAAFPITPISISHIGIDAKGRPAFVGHPRMRLEFVVSHFVDSVDATLEAIADAYPFFSRGEIFAALSYYEDHKAEVDARIASDRIETDRLIAELGILEQQAGLKERLLARMADSQRTGGTRA